MVQKKKQRYEAPVVESLMTRVERGFQTSDPQSQNNIEQRQSAQGSWGNPDAQFN